MIDLDQLEALAKAALWTGPWHNAGCGTVDCTYPTDSPYSGQCGEIAHPEPSGVVDHIVANQPSAILALIAEVRALREDKARLDSGCIVTHERDEFGEEYTCERRGNDLRAMIDAARREKA